MAEVQKPYRVYRGGRVKGKVPIHPPRDGTRPDRDAPRPPKLPRKRWGWPRRIGVLLSLLILLAIGWAIAGYFSLRSGAEQANKRLPRSAYPALAKQDGLLLSHPTTILLLGTDHANTDQRVTAHRSDSIMLVHTDPSRHRLAYLSIPRDLRVVVPGYGAEKINSAMQLGGPALAIRTIRGATYGRLPVNHVVVVDFAQFRDLIDSIGGVDVDVPAPILSNPFDCPYTQERCATWKGWRFAKGKQHMDGRRATIYSRIRVNQLNPAESDFTRAERQQQVMQATLRKLVSFGTFIRLPFRGDDMMKPLATDLSAGQFAQLGWAKFRAGTTLRCRLGGTSEYSGGQAVITPDTDNISVVLQVLGRAAPQLPRPGGGPYAGGCAVGDQQLTR